MVAPNHASAQTCPHTSQLWAWGARLLALRYRPPCGERDWPKPSRRGMYDGRNLFVWSTREYCAMPASCVRGPGASVEGRRKA